MNGEQGDTGERGERGLTGSVGERGPAGDHGQAGDRGQVGDTGATGADSKAFSKGLLTIFAAMLVTFSLLGLLVQQNQSELKRTQVKLQQQQDIAKDAVHEICLVRKTNVERTNVLYRGLIDIESRNPFGSTPKTVKDRVDLYTAALLIPPKCRKP